MSTTDHTAIDDRDATMTDVCSEVLLVNCMCVTHWLTGAGGRYSRHSSPSTDRSPPRRHRRKSFSDQALGALGLGGASDSHRGRSRSRHHGSHSYSESPRGRKSKSEQQMTQAVRAALMAGAVEAFRVRKEPGEWSGDKGKRILTAAITSGAADGLVDRDPNKHGKRHVIESTLAGLATNHFVNGSRSGSRHRGGSGDHGRSSSHGGSGLKNLAATGALAAAGKEAYDRFRSRSRGRSRSSSRDSRGDSSHHRGSKKRSKSVTDYINKGLASLGLEEGGEKSRHRRSARDDHSDDERDSPRRYDDRRRRHRRRARSPDYSDDDRDSDYSPPRYSRRGRDSRDVGHHNPPMQSTKSRAEGEEGRDWTDNSSNDDSDLGDSSDEKGRRKKLRRGTVLATGLASVATIHAAHSVYSGVEKRRKRTKQLEEGKITPEEARKRRLRANLGDAASVGIAALGIRSAVEEWKEVEEKRKESSNFQRQCQERAEKRHRRRAKSLNAPLSRTTRFPDEIEESDGRRFSGSQYHDGLHGGEAAMQRIAY